VCSGSCVHDPALVMATRGVERWLCYEKKGYDIIIV
jgi:hypothetical protein